MLLHQTPSLRLRGGSRHFTPGILRVSALLSRFGVLRPAGRKARYYTVKMKGLPAFIPSD